MLWLTVDLPIVSQGHQVRVVVGSSRPERLSGPLRFNLLDRSGETVDSFNDEGRRHGDHLTAVFPVPRHLENGLYSLHVEALSLGDQASVDVTVLDERGASQWGSFLEAAGHVADRESDDVFEQMDRDALERLAMSYSQAHQWDASVEVWVFLARERSEGDSDLILKYFREAIYDYLRIELETLSSRSYFRDRSLLTIARFLKSGPVQDQLYAVINWDYDSYPVDTALLFISILQELGMSETGLTLELSRALGSMPEPVNLFEVLLLKWPTSCSIVVDREGAVSEPSSFRETHSRVRELRAKALQHHVEASSFDDLHELVVS